MKLMTTEVLELIGKRPGIRTVEISDKLDIDIDVVEASLERPLADGRVFKEEVIAPNRRKATAYRLAESKTDAKPMTNVEKAVAFMKTQPDRKATSSQLHKALGLRATDAPSQYLGAGIKNGILIKDGKNWSLAEDAPAVTVGAAPLAKGETIASASETVVDIPAFLKKPDVVTAAPEPEIKQATTAPSSPISGPMPPERRISIYDEILHQEWKPHQTHADFIQGVYVDGAEYLIVVPPPLREQILTLQNRLSLQVQYIRAMEIELAQAKKALSGIEALV